MDLPVSEAKFQLRNSDLLTSAVSTLPKFQQRESALISWSQNRAGFTLQTSPYGVSALSCWENNIITPCSLQPSLFHLPLGSLKCSHVCVTAPTFFWGFCHQSRSSWGLHPCLPHLNPTAPVCGMELAPEEQLREGVETQLQI